MADKEFIKGQKYTEEEYIELSIAEMLKSQSEHTDKADPKVGAVLVDRDEAYFDKAHRGELRKGDHGEYTLLERKHHGEDLSGFTLYTTLEPCVKRNMPKKGCYKRCVNARLKKVVIGHIDPDPTVARNGVRLLEDAKIEVAYYDRKYEMIIAKANEQFFKEAEQRALEEKTNEIYTAVNPIENELLDFQLTDLSEEAQNEMINTIGLSYKMGSDAYLSFLNKMKLIKVDGETKAARPTGLGLLLLGKEPQVHFPQARIKFTIRRPNTDPIIKDFDGPLVLIPEKIEEYLEFVFPKGFSRTNFQRDETTETSHSAVLEVIMNAIVHRDYTIEGARIMVDIDEEKIVISSPGIPLSPIEKLNNFTAPSNSRNPKIAYLFFEMGFVEERGFGMEELSKLETEYGLPRPYFELDGNILKATIYRNQVKAIVKKKTDLPGAAILQEHKVLGSSRYMELTGVAERTARRHLSDLVKSGLARKVGEGPGTEYVFIE
jgi:ATP-dependent DNA helicase RecG